jgi:pyrroline-5-carboxylate reductase
MSALSAGSHAGPEHLALVEEMLSPVGKVVRVPESQQDAVTALSGSGPAYFFFLVEAMIDAGILLGLPRTVAAELIVQTAVGSARMLRESGEHPGRAARGGHLAGRHDDQRHPRHGGPRRAGRHARRARGARDRSRELAAGG